MALEMFAILLCMFIKGINYSFLCILVHPEGVQVAGCGFRVGVICIVIFNLCF